MRRLPLWLQNLPNGIYSLADLVTLSGGKAKCSISRTFKRFGVPKIYSEEIIHSNMVEVRYQWNLEKTKEKYGLE